MLVHVSFGGREGGGKGGGEGPLYIYRLFPFGDSTTTFDILLLYLYTIF